MKQININKKRENEIRLVSEMIRLYYKKHEGNPEELINYAKLRIGKCPFMETKTFCSACKVHCYEKKRREQIKEVMRWSGPRMLWHHPIMTIKHLIVELKGKQKRKGGKE